MMSSTAAERALSDVACELTRRYDGAPVILTDSGTSALTLALKVAAADSADRPVALPAYCCYDIATATLGAGGGFLLYDVNPHSLSPDLESLRRALEQGADRVVVAHLYGVPVDMASVMELAGEYDATVIEDAAQGAGSSIAGRNAGSVGAIGLLSFGRGKGMTAGAGGALLLNQPRFVERARTLERSLGPADWGASAHAKLVAQWILGRPELFTLPASLPFLGIGETTFKEPRTPHRLSRASAGALVNALRITDAEVARRRATAARFIATIEGSALQQIVPPADSVPGYLRLAVVASEELTGSFDKRDARRLGIMSGYPLPLHTLPGFGDRRMNAAELYPGAAILSQRLLTLPVHGAMSSADVDAVLAWCAERERSVSTRGLSKNYHPRAAKRTEP